MRRLVPALLTAAIGALASPATPVAAAAWSPPQTLVPLGYEDARTAQSASTPDGSLVVVVERERGLWAIVKPPGGTFGPGLELPRPDHGLHGDTWTLRIGPSGRAVVAWHVDHDISVAVREPGTDRFTNWGPVLHGMPDESYIMPFTALDVAIGADGRIFVAWGDGRGALLATAAPPARTFATVAQLGPYPSVTSNPPDPYGYAPGSVAVVAEDGGAAATMVSTTQLDSTESGTTLGTVARRWTTSGGAGPTVEIFKSTSKAYEHGGPTVSGAADVEATAVPGPHPAFFAQRFSATRGRDISEMKNTDLTFTLPAGGGAITPTLLGTQLVSCSCQHDPPSIAVDERGVGSAAWFTLRNSDTGATPTFQLSSRTTQDGTFGAPVSVPAFGQPASEVGGRVWAAPLGGGRTAVMFGDRDSLHRGVVDQRGQVLEGPDRLPKREYGRNMPLFATGPGDGDAISGWFVDDSGDSAIQISVRDVNPPSLQATVGEVERNGDRVRVQLTADARDRWSTHRLRWEFGDGESSDQPSTSHTFAADAAVSVRVTATDAAGNATTRTLAVERAADLTTNTPLSDAGAPSPAASGPRDTAPVSAPTAAPVATPAAAPAAASLTALRLSPSRFRPAFRGQASRGGSTLRLSVSAATRVDLRFERLTSGRRAGGACKTNPAPRRGARCTVALRLWSTQRAVPAGRSEIKVTGRRAGRPLPAGRYRVTARTAGDAGAKPRTATFTIIR